MAGYALGADMMVDSADMMVDPVDSIFSEKMPVVEQLSPELLSWLQDNTPVANIDGDANLAYFCQEGCLAASWPQNNTSPSVFAETPRNLASFEKEGFNQDFVGVSNEGKAEKLCVKRQGRKRPTVNTTNGDIMTQLIDMRTENEESKKMLRQMGDQLNEGKIENEKLKKEVEEMHNTLIKMDRKHSHIFKMFEKVLLKVFDKMKQMAVCNKAHCCSAK